MSLKGSFANAVPIIALYTLAGYRLMPSLQGIYTSVSQLRFASEALNLLMEELNQFQSESLNPEENSKQPSPVKYPEPRLIELLPMAEFIIPEVPLANNGFKSYLVPDNAWKYIDEMNFYR